MNPYAYFVVMQNLNVAAGAPGSVVQTRLFISEEAITKVDHVQLLIDAAMVAYPTWGSQLPIFLRWERLPEDDQFRFAVR
ncbi:MAG: hypothetical protein WC028_30790 [Candidatus Obscuribacterales bacterium]